MTSCNEPHRDVVLESLKYKYFSVIQREDYPHTPELTKEANHLEQAIRQLQTNQNHNAT